MSLNPLRILSEFPKLRNLWQKWLTPNCWSADTLSLKRKRHPATLQNGFDTFTRKRLRFTLGQTLGPKHLMRCPWITWIPWMLHGLPWLWSDRLAAAVVLFDCLRTCCLGTVPKCRSHMVSHKAEQASFIEQTKTVMLKIRKDDW